MYARKQTGKYSCDKCNTKIPAADLEAIYHSQLTGFLFSDDEIAAHLGRSDQSIAESERLLETRTEERDRIKRDMDRLYDLYFAGEIPKEGFGDKYQPLDQRLKQIEAERLDLQVKLDVGKIGKVSRDHMVSEARALHTRWPELSLERKRSIVQDITEEIVVGNEDVQIRLEFEPCPGMSVQKGTHQVGIAARMIVHQDHRARAQLQRPLDDLARIDRCMIDRAPGLHLVGDQDVLAVEEQDRGIPRWRCAPWLRCNSRSAPPRRTATGLFSIAVRDRRSGRRLNDLELRHHRIADAVDFEQPRARRRDRLGEAPENAR